MNENDFENFVESCEELVNDRINLSINKVAKTIKYKEKYNIYSDLHKKLIEKYTIKEVENFASSIYAINDLENEYIYLQGFIDGILLRENLGNKY